MAGPWVTCSIPACTFTGPIESFVHGDLDRGVYCRSHQLTDPCTCDACASATFGTEILSEVRLRTIEHEIAETQQEVAVLNGVLTRLGATRLELLEVAR